MESYWIALDLTKIDSKVILFGDGIKGNVHVGREGFTLGGERGLLFTARQNQKQEERQTIHLGAFFFFNGWVINHTGRLDHIGYIDLLSALVRTV